MKDLHQIQKNILRKLLFTNSARYSRIKPLDMEGSQFKFHLDRLIQDNLVEKKVDGTYELTASGKNIANRIDEDSQKPNMQAKHSVVMCATRNNRTEYLLYQRLKNPFYGCQGFPTGKVQYGETIEETVKRELFEETHLSEGKIQLIGIRHYRVYLVSNNELAEDKVMYVFEIKDPIGSIKGNKEGDFKWVKVNEIDNFVTNPLEEFNEVLAMVKSFDGQITFKEIKHFTNKF